MKNILLSVERRANLAPKVQKEIPYKEFKNAYIRADKSFWKTYKASLKSSHIRVFPSFYYKLIGVRLLRFLGLKEKTRKHSHFFGVALHWYFIKKKYLPIQADIIYKKPHTAILIYTKEKYVVKVAFSKNEQSRLKNEIFHQCAARKISSTKIFIPEILQEYHDEQFSFKKEVYVPGKKLNFSIVNNIEKHYSKVFAFMTDFYLANGITQKPVKEIYKKNQEILEFIRNHDYGNYIVSVSEKLISENKEVLLIQTHGDLSHHNVLYYDKELFIIDWGEAEYTLMHKDFYSSSYYPIEEYEKLLVRGRMNQELLYSFDEQLFIGKFISLLDYISQRWQNGNPSFKVYRKMKSMNKKLLKIAAKDQLIKKFNY